MFEYKKISLNKTACMLSLRSFYTLSENSNALFEGIYSYCVLSFTQKFLLNNFVPYYIRGWGLRAGAGRSPRAELKSERRTLNFPLASTPVVICCFQITSTSRLCV